MIRSSDATRLAALFLDEHARTADPGTAMAAALSRLAAARVGETARHVASVVAAVEAICEIDLRSTRTTGGHRAPGHRAKSIGTRGLAYWLIYKQDISVGKLAAHLGRDHSSVSKTLEAFTRRLAESAELRARVAWVTGQLERRAA